MLSFTFPDMEIHHSKEPIAWIMYPSRQIKAYKLRVLSGKFFYIQDGKKFQGIFEIDPRKAWHYGKGVPIYMYDSRSIMPLDPIVVDELSQFAKKNKLVQITQTDKSHSMMLTDIMKTVKDKALALKELTSIVDKRKASITEALQQFQENIAKSPPEQMPSEEKLGSILTNHLVERGLINGDEKGQIDSGVARGAININMLIAKLRDKEILKITEPMSQDSHVFLTDFGASNPEQLASFVAGLRRLDKGVRQMTSIPIKTWMPASIIFAILIGGSIAVMILAQNVGDLGSIIPGLPQTPADVMVNQGVTETIPAEEPPLDEPDVPIDKPDLVWDAVNQTWVEPVWDEVKQDWVVPDVIPDETTP